MGRIKGWPPIHEIVCYNLPRTARSILSIETESEKAAWLRAGGH